ncbi:hypothetical protein [Parasitella parasitica]|uniref:Uncharacterized protein n=1 Tax=Parasitella parasitica TaxID=35722 RepID=A0A0B7NM80_9FUNG|nr:hypothetical protein [Parasitella parasitica]
MKMDHKIQRETSEKQFIQENSTKVNLKSFNSLKEAVLVAINSNKPLKKSNKMKFLSSDDLEKSKTFIAAIQMEI